MKSRWIKKAFRILILLILVLFVSAFAALHIFLSPRSDEEVFEAFEDSKYLPHLERFEHRGHQVRILKMQKAIDTTLPTMVFVHGSPGSSLDFKRYLADERLNEKANLVSYDRPGYNENDTGRIMNSVAEESDFLFHLLRHLELEDHWDQIVLVGYSYGGTLVMDSAPSYQRKILLAAAVRGDLEPMFWALKLCVWPLTRPLVPVVLRAAAQEKYRHVTELVDYDENWRASEAAVLSIHGKKDFIVPYENSLYLKRLLGDQFKLITLEEGDHALIWNEFDLIHEELIKSLDR